MAPPKRDEARPTARKIWYLPVSLLVLDGWAVLLLLYAGFWASGFTAFQNLVILLSSLIAALGIVAILWTARQAVHTHAPASDQAKSRWPFMNDVQSFLGFMTILIFSIILFFAMI